MGSLRCYGWWEPFRDRAARRQTRCCDSAENPFHKFARLLARDRRTLRRDPAPWPAFVLAYRPSVITYARIQCRECAKLRERQSPYFLPVAGNAQIRSGISVGNYPAVEHFPREPGALPKAPAKAFAEKNRTARPVGPEVLCKIYVGRTAAARTPSNGGAAGPHELAVLAPTALQVAVQTRAPNP